MNQTQYLNYAAIHLLEKAGFMDPSQGLIDVVESRLQEIFEDMKEIQTS